MRERCAGGFRDDGFFTADNDPYRRYVSPDPERLSFVLDRDRHVPTNRDRGKRKGCPCRKRPKEDFCQRAKRRVENERDATLLFHSRFFRFRCFRLPFAPTTRRCLRFQEYNYPLVLRFKFQWRGANLTPCLAILFSILRNKHYLLRL